MILDDIKLATQKRLESAKQSMPLEEVMKIALDMENNNSFPFTKALEKSGMSFICEVKKGSPSKGIISADFPYMDIAKKYEKMGADAISVLTEPDFFKGSNAYLQEIHQKVKTPLLRKDFTVDKYMIYKAKTLGASAILLICSILTKEEIKEYLYIAHSLGLSALVETHNEYEIETALECGAEIIGVNNRNLKTFDVDISTSERLRKYIPEDKIFVAESGMHQPEDIQRMKNIKADAVLIGEAFMRCDNPAELLKSFKE
ncbi:MAG: indole-3-glycerol phosphate synthase TrpC [Oscillospiraceae bacterium]|nr:indole-3-glycerol phosphate synthase TrpC [Oscillospiraceae bacterium]